MSTVKISQLPVIDHLNANTANTLFAGVDIPTGATGKISVHTLAQGIFENEVLKVGVTDITFPNVIGQLTGNGSPYLQVNLQNLDGAGSSDYVATADIGSDTTYFVDVGINGSTTDVSTFDSMDPLDAYLIAQANNSNVIQPGANLVIGTATSGKLVRFISGGLGKANIVMTLTSVGPSINSGSHLTFGDGSTQTVAAAPANYTQSAFDAANTNASNITIVRAVNDWQNTQTTLVNQYAVSAYNQANTNASNILGANAYSLQVNQYAAAAYAQANATIGVDATQNTNILNANAYTLTVNQFAQSAYNVANSALANTTGTFAGDLTTTGNVTTGYIRASYKTSNPFDVSSFVQLTQTASGTVIAPHLAGFSIHATGREGSTSRVVLDSIGANVFPNYLTRHARGVANTPTPSQSGDTLGRYSSVGYGNTQFNSTSDARIDVNALENFTDSAHGTSIQVYTTPIGSNTATRTINFSSGNTGLYSANTYVSGNLTVIGATTFDSSSNTSVGNINVNKNITVNGTMILANSNFLPTESAVLISATPTVAVPANDGYMLHISGKEGIPSRIVYDSYGAGAYAVVAGRSARGTVASPTAVANNDVLMRVSGNGHGGGANGWTQFGVARMDIVATENYTATNRGSQIQFWNCPIGSNTLQQIAAFNGDSVHFTGVVSPQKGFILTPNVILSNVTTETINFANDSLKKLQINNDCTVTLSNFVAGKIVEVWITNMSGSNRQVTHGVSALNSTTNSTAVTLPATSSAYFKYFSIGGDAANTFLSVVHA